MSRGNPSDLLQFERVTPSVEHSKLLWGRGGSSFRFESEEAERGGTLSEVRGTSNGVKKQGGGVDSVIQRRPSAV